MKQKTIIKSIKVTSTIAKNAQKNLSKLGLTISEYLRISLSKAAVGNVKVINYFNTPKFKKAEYNAQTGKVTNIATNKNLCNHGWITYKTIRN